MAQSQLAAAETKRADAESETEALQRQLATATREREESEACLSSLKAALDAAQVCTIPKRQPLQREDPMGRG